MRNASVFWEKWGYFFFSAMLLFCLLPPFALGGETQPPCALIVHSYHQGMKWTDGFHQGMMDAFAGASEPVVSKTMYLHGLYRNNPEELYLLKRLIPRKLDGFDFQVVLTSDNDALEFVLENRFTLFKNAPVVFSGVNNFTPEMIQGIPAVTGVAEEPSILETLEAALSLHPRAKEIIFVGDTVSTTGQILVAQLQAHFGKALPPLPYQIWVNQTEADLRRRLPELSPDRILMWIGMILKRDGQVMDIQEQIRTLRRYSPAPIYSCWSHTIGQGYVGGKIVSSFNQGKIAGEKALQILAGTPAGEIPVTEVGEANLWMFDYDELERFQIPLEKLPPGSTVLHRPDSYYQKHKRLIQLLVAAALLVFSQAVLILFLVRNMEKRKQAEEKLRESETLYRLTLGNVHDTVFLTDDRGDFTFCCPNDSFVTGYSDAEIMAMGNVRSLIPEELVSAKTLADRRNVQNIEVEITAKDGTIKNVLVGIKGVDFNGSRRLYTLHDVTEIKELQHRLTQAQKIESIGYLAGGIAHDFNNLLFPILGMSEMLLDDLPPEGEAREMVLEILKATQRGADLVKQILTFSRQSKHEKAPIDVRNIAKEAFHLSRSTIPSNIGMIDDLPRLSGRVMADPTQIHQVLINLITNAYHAAEETGGEIRVRLRERTLPGEAPEGPAPMLPPGDYVEIAVADTGAGMDAATLEKIFDPFFTTKAPGKGTGLGLSVVHGIVKEHRGDIQCRSEMGRGTEFRVYLPLMDADGPPSPKPVSVPEQTGSERILLVDDEETIVLLEKQMLERLGYRIDAWTRGQDALRVFQENPGAFDLMITDMAMPWMTGEELAREVLAVRPEMPIILCTGFSDRISRESAREIGIREFLMKPVGRTDLARTVRRLLDETPKRPGEEIREEAGV